MGVEGWLIKKKERMVRLERAELRSAGLVSGPSHLGGPGVDLEVLDREELTRGRRGRRSGKGGGEGFAAVKAAGSR